MSFIVSLIGDGYPDMGQHTRVRTPMQLRVREGQFVNTDQFVRTMKSEPRCKEKKAPRDLSIQFFINRT